MQLRTNYAANRIINAISHNIRHEHTDAEKKAEAAAEEAPSRVQNQDEKLSIGLAIHRNPIPGRTHTLRALGAQ